MSNPIPSSPIPQTPPYPRVKAICNKCGFIGTCEDDRGILRHYRRDGYVCAYSATKLPDASNGPARIEFPKPNPTDAAELERLRKVEDEAAKVILQFLSADISPSNAAVTSWRNHFYARIAFEAKIGGGK